jgi:cell division protein FtsB
MTDETIDQPSEHPADDPVDEPNAVLTNADTDVDVASGVDPGADSGVDPVVDVVDVVDAVEAESRAQAARRIVWAPRTRIAVASLALVAMMFLFVFPTRSYIAQKRQVGRAANAVEVLEAQNEVLKRQADRLQTPSEIERLAREQFNMVMPGEQAYNVVETPSSSDDTTTTTP